jgi:hypothetical protein
LLGKNIAPERIDVSEEGANRQSNDEDIRVNNEASSIVNDQASLVFRVVDTCIGSLATFPALLSSSGEATRDAELFTLICQFEDEAFFALTSTYLHYVHLQMLHLSSSNLTKLLDEIAARAGAYAFSGSDEMSLLLVTVLRSTVHIWASATSEDGELVSKVDALCAHTMSFWERRRTPSWEVADAMACFLDDYLRANPSETAWGESLPMDAHTFLHSLAENADIRVRWRSAVASARSFEVAKELQVPAKNWYQLIREHLSTQMDKYVSSHYSQI